MSLFLGVFDGDREIEGWVFGHYSDFGAFRDAVRRLAGEGFPTLLTVSDANGTWSASECETLRTELAAIRGKLSSRPPVELKNAFEHTLDQRRRARSAADCFHNVDGENVFDAIDSLCAVAIKSGHPIVFQ